MSEFIRKQGAVVNTNRSAYLAAKAARAKDQEIQSMKDRINTLEQQVQKLMGVLNERQSTTDR